MCCEQAQKLVTTQQCQRFPFGKLVSIWAIGRCRDKNALIGPFVMHCAKKVTYRSHTHNVGISLGLNDDLAATNRIGIKRDCINTAIAAGLCNLDLSSVFTEFLFKYFSNQIFKINPIHCGQIGAII
jgi:hypothetical protein